MKQLMYTSCEAGKSVDGAPGFQIRAASLGIGAERMRAALPHIGYGLPAEIRLKPAASSSLPVRLAFLKLANLGAVLCHSVAAGADPTTHRPGNFFSHMLLDLPSSFTAREAINGWDSESWRRTDGSFDVAAADLAELSDGKTLTDESMRAFLSSERGRNMFRLVLAAFVTQQDCRIFLAAPSSDIAFCVYGLARVLPETCLGTLTFSTYESRPLNCPARIVGTWARQSGDTDMPSACYSGKAVGYNSHTGRSSEVVFNGEFVDFATTAANTGDYKKLDELRALWSECRIDDTELLNVVYRAENGATLAKVDLGRLAFYPRFLAHLLGKLTMQRTLLEVFLQDQNLTRTLTADVICLLSKELTAALRKTARAVALDSIFRGDLARTRALLEHILPAIDRTGPAIAPDVFDAIKDPGKVPWKTRAYLLTQITGIPPGRDTIPPAWLTPSSPELPLLCALPLPIQWKAKACLNNLRKSEGVEALAAALTSYPELLARVFHDVPANGIVARRVTALTCALLAKSSAPCGLVDQLVRHRAQLRPEIVSAFVMAAASSNRIDLLHLASQTGQDLLEALNDEGLGDLLTSLLDCRSERLLSDLGVVAFLRAAARRELPESIRASLDSILAIRDFLDRPVLTEHRLANTALGLRVLTGTAIPNLVLQAALNSLFAEEDSPATGKAVDCLVRHLGPLTSGGLSGLYTRLLTQCRKKKEFWKQPYLISALISFGLGQSEATAMSGHAAVMAEQARDLAQEVARRSKQHIFRFIDQGCRSWQPEARLRWNLFAKFVRPRSLLSRLTGKWNNSGGRQVLEVHD